MAILFFRNRNVVIKITEVNEGMIKETIYHYLYNQANAFVDYWVDTYYIHTEEHKLRIDEKNYLTGYKKECLYIFQALQEAMYKNEDITAICYGVGEDRAAMSTPYKEVYLNFFKFNEIIIEFLINAQHSNQLMISDGDVIEYIKVQKKQEVENHYALFTGYMGYTTSLFK